MRIVSIEVGCPEEIHDYNLLEIPDDWNLEELKKEWWKEPKLATKFNLRFVAFLIERGAKEVKVERFDAD